jgi:hypothetical protein
MAPSTLSRRLLQHGIEACSTPNTALLALAADLPAPVIADLLGLHVDTAACWAGLRQPGLERRPRRTRRGCTP